MGVTAHPRAEAAPQVPALPEGWRHLTNTGQCEVRKRSPNTIWRQELSELSSLGRRKFWLGQLCLFVCGV